jgi:hypothetical protein
MRMERRKKKRFGMMEIRFLKNVGMKMGMNVNVLKKFLVQDVNDPKTSSSQSENSQYHSNLTKVGFCFL